MLNQKTVESDPRANVTTYYAYDKTNQLCGSGPNLASGASQLTCSTIQPGDNSYSYDAAGNRTQQSEAGTTSYLTYNPANELCWVSTTSGTACSSPPSGATTYSFDGNGNVSATATPTSSYGYNAQNQTTSITANGSTLSSLGYANLDESERTSATQGSATTSFLSSPMGLDSTTTSSVSTYTVREPTGSLIGYVDGSGNNWYYWFDGQGSVVAVISGDGSTVGNRYAYDEWGRSVYSFPSPSVTQPYGYDGGYTDPTGLVLFGARYYDPSTGRWTQQDPAGPTELTSENRYLYGADDPVNEQDLSGLNPWWWGFVKWAAIAVISGIISWVISVVFPWAVPIVGRFAVGCATGFVAAYFDGHRSWGAEIGYCLAAGAGGVLYPFIKSWVAYVIMPWIAAFLRSWFTG